MTAGGISYAWRTKSVLERSAVMLLGVASLTGTVLADTRRGGEAPTSPLPPGGPSPIDDDVLAPESEKMLMALVELRTAEPFLARPVSFLTNLVDAHSSSNATSSNPASASCSSMAASRTRSMRRSASRMMKTKISLTRSPKCDW